MQANFLPVCRQVTYGQVGLLEHLFGLHSIREACLMWFWPHMEAAPTADALLREAILPDTPLRLK